MRRKSPKYGNRKIDTPDGRFDSRGEYRRWQDLKILEAAEEIKGLKRQVKYILIPKQTGKSGKKYREMTYKPDFVYLDDGELIVEDYKSPITAKEPLFVAKMKLMLERHGIEIRITHG
ncbi:MAG: DUF1064 domain-containing protein [Chloroflexi bacterium]|nr:DUF1064 domain-containing protein [Chloroflexota bacterium]